MICDRISAQSEFKVSRSGKGLGTFLCSKFVNKKIISLRNILTFFLINIITSSQRAKCNDSDDYDWLFSVWRTLWF